MNKPVVIVGGVHGAGKTTLCHLLTRLIGAEHVTAGTLIRAAAADGVTVRVGTKAVPDVDANQELLLRGLISHQAGGTEASQQTRGLLLDGHFCLFDPVGRVIEIPYPVFDVINPVAVLLVETDLGVVVRRLLQRDGDAQSAEALRTLAACERTYATAVCARLNIPLYCVSGEENPSEVAQLAAFYLQPHLLANGA